MSKQTISKIFGIIVIVSIVSVSTRNIGRALTAANESVPSEIAPETAKGHSPIAAPENLAAARKRLHAASDVLNQQVLPLIAQMPEELKRAQDLIKTNDELLHQLAALDAK